MIIPIRFFDKNFQEIFRTDDTVAGWFVHCVLETITIPENVHDDDRKRIFFETAKLNKELDSLILQKDCLAFSAMKVMVGDQLEDFILRHAFRAIPGIASVRLRNGERHDRPIKECLDVKIAVEIEKTSSLRWDANASKAKILTPIFDSFLNKKSNQEELSNSPSKGRSEQSILKTENFSIETNLKPKAGMSQANTSLKKHVDEVTSSQDIGVPETTAKALNAVTPFLLEGHLPPFPMPSSEDNLTSFFETEKVLSL